MTIFHAAVLGLIQGLTEFLPVSSSGHLIFLPKFFGWTDQGTGFDAVINVGTLLAVVIYFRKELWNMLRVLFSSKQEEQSDRRLAWHVALSCVPAAIVGLLLNDLFRSVELIGIDFIVWGIILGLADWYYQTLQRTQPGKLRQLTDLGWKDVAIISLAQALALFPGTSRSGITMTAGLFSRLDKSAAATFSFLMSVPIIGLASADGVLHLVKGGLGDLTITTLLVGFAVSAVSGFIAIGGLMKIIKKWSYMPFVVYRVVLGVVILLALS